MTNYQKGLLITLGGVLAFIPDTILLRLIDDLHFSTIMAYRGLLASLTLFLGILIFSPPISSLKTFTSLRTPHFLMITFMTITNYSFVIAVTYTSVANSLFIVCTSPVFAAIFTLLFLKEKISIPTLLTIISVIIGISLIAYQNLNPNALNSFSSLGDIAALIAALSLAASLSVARFLKGEHISHVTCLGFLVSGIFGIILTPTFFLPSTTHIIAILALGLFVSPFGYGLINYGPRFLPAPEVGLFLLLEAASAPVIVWFIFNEYPGNLAIIGGTIVLASLTVSTLYTLVQSRK